MTELKPCYAFINATLWEQYNKLAEELDEVRNALMAYENSPEDTARLGALVEETVDIQIAAETFLAIVGLDDEGRDAARAVAYAKNKARGYYNKPPEC